MGRLFITVLAATLFAAGFPFDAGAQETDTVPASETAESESAEPPSQPIEEIVVRYQRNFFRLKRDIVQAEENIFQLFNENNSSDKMDIICKKRKHTFSHILRRVCEPVFLSEMRTRNAISARMGFTLFFNNFDLLAEVGAEMDQLQAEIVDMIDSNEAYSAALANYAELVQNYDELRESRWGSN